MISTAAARSAFDASAVDASFTWTFPGAPLRINIPFDLIARLKADVSTPGSDDVPKVEIGGILLGKRGKSTVEIRDYVLAFRGQHSPVQYSVNVAVLEILRQSDSDLSVVGYFRTQSEGTLQLREDEVELVGKHFRDPSDVVLLIQTSCEPNNAGFLCWNEGVFLPYSFMEFPFDGELLRREIEARLLSPAIARDETGEATLQHPVEGTALEAPPPRTRVRPDFSRRTMLTAGLAAAAVMLALTAFVVRDRWLPARNRPVIPRVSVVSFPLEVEAQGTGINLRWNPQNIPAGKALGGVLEIREGEQSPQLIGLNPDQLAVGHIYYQSAAQRIEFRLEVSDAFGPLAKGAVLALLSPPAVVPSAQGHPVDQAPARKVQSVPIIPREPIGVVEKSSPLPRRFFAPQPLKKGAEPAKPIVDATAPELSNAANARVPLPETPGGLSAALRLPPLNPPVRAPNPVPAETATAPPQQSREPARAATSTARETARPAIQPVIQSTLKPPLPERKVQPILRPAMSAQIPPNTDIEVTVRAQIDATGRVVKADVLREHPAQGGVYAQLEIAALDAIKQWRFSPARMGNQFVPSDYAITFHFQKH